MKAIRKYLLNDSEMLNLLGGNNIFFIEKPYQVDIENYIIYKYKPIDGGLVKRYQIEFNVIGKDLNTLIEIQNRLIQLLDDYRSEFVIEDADSFIRQINLINGGGQLKNPDTGNYEIILYFLGQI